ncbi:MAG: NADPH-dependent FMN reductase [Deltaproteobacteria bacterium]
MERRVAVFVGSLRTASWSRKVTRELITLAPHSLQPEIVEIGQLPLYNQDFDDNGKPPAAWTTFRQQVKAFDAGVVRDANFCRRS